MDTRPSKSTSLHVWPKAIAALAMAFGVLTVFSGGNVLFGPVQAREMAGDYIPFVVWFNFLAGFVYIIAAFGLWLNKIWASWLAIAISTATAIVILIFAATIIRGNAFEMRTVGALSFRFLFWTIIAVTMRGKKVKRV